MYINYHLKSEKSKLTNIYDRMEYSLRLRVDEWLVIFSFSFFVIMKIKYIKKGKLNLVVTCRWHMHLAMQNSLKMCFFVY